MGYTRETLTPHTGSTSADSHSAYGINASGVAVGFSGGRGGAVWNAGQQTPSRLDPIPPDDTGTLGNDINDSGLVAGKSSHGADTDVGGEQTTACTWSTGGLSAGVTIAGTRLLNPPGTKSLTIAVNNSGRVIGRSVIDGSAQSWRYDNGVWTVLRALPGGGATAVRRLNAAGDIVGLSIGGGGQKPAVWKRGALDPIELVTGRPLTTPAVANDINSSGQIVGKAWHFTAERYHACMWHLGGPSYFQDLGVLSGDHESEAFAINDLGQVVGVSTDWTDPENAVQRAFVWDPANGMQYLGDLLDDPLTGDESLVEARDINASGMIVGSGRFTGALLSRPFRLTPS